MLPHYQRTKQKIINKRSVVFLLHIVVSTNRGREGWGGQGAQPMQHHFALPCCICQGVLFCIILFVLGFTYGSPLMTCKFHNHYYLLLVSLTTLMIIFYGPKLHPNLSSNMIVLVRQMPESIWQTCKFFTLYQDHWDINVLRKL